jgi:ribosomal protein S19E (S16A)
MQIAPQLSFQLQEIKHTFIQASFYDPTTYYLGEKIIDRDEFKKLKKEGLIEVVYQDSFGRRYSLSHKGMELIDKA